MTPRVQDNGRPRTGLFFGSFNPIHRGHEGIARYLLDEQLCDEVWFVVSPCNPFKVDHFLLPEDQRLQIVKAAIGYDSRLTACDVEFSMPKPSYTVDTLRLLFERYPGRSFTLIIGEDNVANFSGWKDYRWILAHCPIFVYPRAGEKATVTLLPGMTPIHAPLFPLSATEIREMIRQDRDISHLVPGGALSLILVCYGENKNK